MVRRHATKRTNWIVFSGAHKGKDGHGRKEGGEGLASISPDS